MCWWIHFEGESLGLDPDMLGVVPEAVVLEVLTRGSSFHVVPTRF